MENIYGFIMNYPIVYVIGACFIILLAYFLFKNKHNAENNTCLVNLSRDYKTGDKSLILQNSGTNKVALLATIRQVFNCGLGEAKSLIDNAPCPLIEGVSDEEATNIKTALEFVGATIDIK